MFGLFDYLKLGIGALAGAALMAVPACQYGKSEERQAIKLAEAKAALERVQTLEKNNADFRNGTARDRCLVFMRDSGLPLTAPATSSRSSPTRKPRCWPRRMQRLGRQYRRTISSVAAMLHARSSGSGGRLPLVQVLSMHSEWL
jgi:hypothetical protein